MYVTLTFHPVLVFADKAGAYPSGTPYKTVRLVYIGNAFKAEMLVKMTRSSHYFNCLGQLGWCDRDRIFYIFVVPPKVAKASTVTCHHTCCRWHYCTNQGMLKGEVSLYCWPPVWLVWICLFCTQKQKFSVVIQLIPNQSNRRSMVQWYFPLKYSLHQPSLQMKTHLNGSSISNLWNGI